MVVDRHTRAVTALHRGIGHRSDTRRLHLHHALNVQAFERCFREVARIVAKVDDVGCGGKAQCQLLRGFDLRRKRVRFAVTEVLSMKTRRLGSTRMAREVGFCCGCSNGRFRRFSKTVVCEPYQALATRAKSA